MKLRDYQQEAVDAIYGFFRVMPEGNPLVVMPTGSGKSVVIGEFVRGVMEAWPDQRILVLTHVKELIEQNHAKLMALWPGAPAGIHSAGLKRRDTHHPILFAGIQSIYRRAHALGRIDLVLIDECHLVPKDGEGQYRTFLAEAGRLNPSMKVIGFTATPYRLKGGSLIEGDGRLFTNIAYDTDVLRLIQAGYLAPLVPKHMGTQIRTEGVAVRGGDFVVQQLLAAADRNDVVEPAVREAIELGKDRKKWLFFGVGVSHALHIRNVLREHGIDAETVTGKTPLAERDAIINAFRAGEIRALTNADVLTTGFDVPDIDLLAMLRPTASPGLYVQIMGRGMRIAPGKENCLVLDYGGNVLRHGPINDVRPPREGKGGGPAPMKVCPECDAPVYAGVMTCPDCGYEWPGREAEHMTTASTLDVIDWTKGNEPRWVDVQSVSYVRHDKLGGIPSMRVVYEIGLTEQYSEWICVQHQGYPREKAVSWWKRAARNPGVVTPNDVADAVRRARYGELAEPKRIKVRKNGKYWEVVNHEYPDRALVDAGLTTAGRYAGEEDGADLGAGGAAGRGGEDALATAPF